jgi:hypothetical protein
MIIGAAQRDKNNVICVKKKITTPSDQK